MYPLIIPLTNSMFETYASFGTCLESAPCPTSCVINFANMHEVPTTVEVVPFALFFLMSSLQLMLYFENHVFTNSRIFESLLVMYMFAPLMFPSAMNSPMNIPFSKFSSNVSGIIPHWREPLEGYTPLADNSSIFERTIARCNLALLSNGKVNAVLLFSSHQFDGIFFLSCMLSFIISIAVFTSLP